MVDPHDRNRPGSAGARRNWIPWAIAAAVLLLILIFGMRSCSETADNTAGGTAPATSDDIGAPLSTTGATITSAGGLNDAFTVEGMRGYLQETGPADAAGRTFGLDQVTFDTGSAQLDQQDLETIGEVAGVLKQFPNASVTITGYADPAGDAAANKKLAAQRAVAVKQALQGAGLSAAKLMTNVVGETGSAAIPQNRRVELLVRR